MPAALHVAYDTEELPFARLAAAVLGVADLRSLASVELARKRMSDPQAALTAADNSRLRALLRDTPAEHPLRVAYRRLGERVIGHHFGGRALLTQNPTFRVHLTGTPSISAWHRDADITSRPDYVTCWVPFVDTDGENGLWVETGYGTDEFEPMTVRYGEILVFDGAMLTHGSRANEGAPTRLSMDFRFAPIGDGAHAPDRGIFAGRPASVRSRG